MLFRSSCRCSSWRVCAAKVFLVDSGIIETFSSDGLGEVVCVKGAACEVGLNGKGHEVIWTRASSCLLHASCTQTDDEADLAEILSASDERIVVQWP